MTATDRIAWIFLAIWFWDKNPVDRQEVVHSADAIHQVEPLESDIDMAVCFLTQHDLLEANGDLFSITESGQVMIGAANTGAGNIYDTLRSLTESITSLDAV
ncbi:hypothetical protein H9L17_04985 [Thermomonas brevis]|uniref:Uncharacterized protein n=1 Tax=Thermomonas brevis TaxID=215691 RepID=A0A7G9QVX1_9GAMM|nr:hypothetical protein [Thermomonas brevis]QNN47496.1 hypothetical protein H9L17_04985 [Thermomonas brevis]